MPRFPRAHLDPLNRWLSLDFSRPERSYYPDLRDFLSELLGYPRDKVVTEDRSGEGYPDLVLLNAQGDPWVVGDFKLEDRHIADPASNEALWREKRKYVTGTTRYVLFVTPRYLQLRDATGREVVLLHLLQETTDLLRQKLAPISWEKARHEEDWKALVEGRLPYAYLVLDPEGTRKLQEDLKVSFAELTEAASRALLALEERYQEYRGKREEAERNLAGALEETRRRILARIEGEYPEALKALFERHLPRFADQYGREVEGEEEPGNPRIREAFAADSAAALTARADWGAETAFQVRERLGEVLAFRGAFLADYLADPQAPVPWRARLSGGGRAGVVGDLGAHLFDLAAWLLGRPLEEVIARAAVLFPGRENPDWAGVIAQAGRARGVLELSRVHPVRPQALFLELEGEKGALKVIPALAGRAEEAKAFWSGRPGVLEPLPPDPGLLRGRDPREPWGLFHFRELVRRFLGAIARGEKPTPSLREGVLAQAVIEAVLNSSLEGKAKEVEGV